MQYKIELYLFPNRKLRIELIFSFIHSQGKYLLIKIFSRCLCIYFLLNQQISKKLKVFSLKTVLPRKCFKVFTRNRLFENISKTLQVFDIKNRFECYGFKNKRNYSEMLCEFFYLPFRKSLAGLCFTKLNRPMSTSFLGL